MPLTGVVVPAYGCQDTLERVLSEVPEGYRVFVVDDGSDPPLRAAVPVLRHERNRGYGAAQKTGYTAALDAGVDRVVLLHGDGQYATADTLALADALGAADACIGSRFLADPSVIPGWRRAGNRALTGLANLRYGTRHTELHTGARAFRAEVLRRTGFSAFSDDYLFDQQMLCALLRDGARIAERPVRVRYDGTVQSISFARSVTYGLGCVREILRV